MKNFGVKNKQRRTIASPGKLKRDIEAQNFGDFSKYINPMKRHRFNTDSNNILNIRGL